MLCKRLFIIHVTVKGVLKSYTVVQKQSTSVTKVGMTHAYLAGYLACDPYFLFVIFKLFISSDT